MKYERTWNKVTHFMARHTHTKSTFVKEVRYFVRHFPSCYLTLFSRKYHVVNAYSNQLDMQLNPTYIYIEWIFNLLWIKINFNVTKRLDNTTFQHIKKKTKTYYGYERTFADSLKFCLQVGFRRQKFNIVNKCCKRLRLEMDKTEEQ